MKIKKQVKYLIYLAIIAFILIPFITVIIDSSKSKKDYKAFEKEPSILTEGESKVSEVYPRISLRKNIEDLSYYHESYKKLNALEVSLYSLGKLNFTDFSNILRFRDVEYVKYTGRDIFFEPIPQDFSYVLNQLPNLKVVNIYEAESIKKENYDSIKDLKAETLHCRVNKKEYFSIFNSMKELKRLYVNSEFNVVDLNPVIIENKTLETLDFNYAKLTSNRMLYDFINDEMIRNNTDVIKLDTPNLKNLTINYSYQISKINLEMLFDYEDVNMESITINNADSIKFPERQNKIKVKKLVFDNINFNRFNVKEDLKGIDLDSVRSLVIKGASAQTSTNTDFVNEFKFLEELEH